MKGVLMASSKKPKNVLVKGISIAPDLYEESMTRAKSLGMRWSEYIRKCIQNDLGDGGSFVIKPRPNPGPARGKRE